VLRSTTPSPRGTAKVAEKRASKSGATHSIERIAICGRSSLLTERCNASRSRSFGSASNDTT
jgi:hypothetical protein